MYLADHLEHMQECPDLVCVCCSAKKGDHFVPFKYPQNLGSTYEKTCFNTLNSYGGKSNQFILDKEKRCFLTSN